MNEGATSRIELALSGGVALLALAVSTYTVYIQRQQLKVQAWPRLGVDAAGDTRFVR